MFSIGNHVIRRAEVADIPFIMDFFDKYWEKGCLLSRDRAYFEYEYLVDGKVNFFVGSHKDTGSIDATVGYIQCSKNTPHDGFTIMWVAKPRCGTKFLGFAVAENILELSGCRLFVGIGLNEGVGAKLADSVNVLKHYYRLSNRDSFVIADIAKKKWAAPLASDKKLINMPTLSRLRAAFDFSKLPDIPMYKDEWYVGHRYYNHPYYKFNIWGIEEAPGKTVGALVGRIVRHNGARALRIMDFFGPSRALDGIGAELDIIMKANDIEYTDFYCAGIPHENMANAGFVLKDEADGNIIPNHFEPYEKKNIAIYYNELGARVFKGDADQGRPKRLRLPEEWNDNVY